MNDLENNHPLHATLFGIGVAAAGKVLGLENTQALVAGAAVGGGTYLYMNQFGHALPWDAATLGESSVDASKAALPTAPQPTPSAQPPPPSPAVSQSLASAIKRAALIAPQGVTAALPPSGLASAAIKAAAAASAATKEALAKAVALPPTASAAATAAVKVQASAITQAAATVAATRAMATAALLRAMSGIPSGLQR